MPNTYSQICIHAVFAVKYRQALIEKDFKKKFMSVIGTHVNEIGCKTIIINGVEDHVHCLFHLLPKLSVSDVIKKAKANSSLWLNSSKLLNKRFEWQSGFAAFSVSTSDINDVYNYILNQEEHHKNVSFHEEYLKLLKHNQVDYNSEYLFRDLI